MGIVINILFTALAAVGGSLFAVNVTLMVLKFTHHRHAARQLALRAAPIAAYFRLGGLSQAEIDRSKHA